MATLATPGSPLVELGVARVASAAAPMHRMAAAQDAALRLHAGDDPWPGRDTAEHATTD